MPILMPIRKKWSDMILNNEKPLEFRNKIGKNFHIGDTIFIYESGKDGCKRVVGEATISSLTKINHKRCDTLIFIEYFLENILKDHKLTEEWKKTEAIELKNYNDLIKLPNILCSDYLIALKEDRIDTFKYTRDVLERKDLSKKIANEADEWLYKIGYYNSWGETNYNYIIELTNIKKYIIPLELNNFINNGNIIKRAPQSWCYCEKRSNL